MAATSASAFPTGPSARQIAASVREGTASAVEILAERRRLAQARPLLNIFTATDWDGAQRTAEQIDRRRARGETLGPLAGVPITVKDVVAVAGLPLTAGSKAFKDNLATSTAPAVQRLLDADAVLLGKTNCPEFAFGFTCDNQLFGETANPRYPGRSPGGSSGGEAAAVAAGISSIGVGTDFGGSLRWPAQCTGMVALRPTFGRVDPSGQVPGLAGSMADGSDGGPAWPSPTSLQGQSQVIGPLAATIDDLVLALAIMQTSAARAETPRPLDGLRIGWSSGRQLGPVRQEIADAVASAVGELANRCRVTELSDVFADCLPRYNRLRAIDPMRDHTRAVRGREDQVAGFCLDTFTASFSATPDQLADAWRDALAARAAALAVFNEFAGGDGVDVIVLPVAGGPACLPNGFVDIDGIDVGGWELMAHCRAVTLTGCPAVSVPIASTHDGLPISVQVVAAPGRDILALTVAAALQLRQTSP
jgi:amidase